MSEKSADDVKVQLVLLRAEMDIQRTLIGMLAAVAPPNVREACVNHLRSVSDKHEFAPELLGPGHGQEFARTAFDDIAAAYVHLLSQR